MQAIPELEDFFDLRCEEEHDYPMIQHTEEKECEEIPLTFGAPAFDWYALRRLCLGE